MLRLHVVRARGVGYYVDDLVPGRAEGSPVAGESPGVWTGGGGAALDLRGSVASGDLAAVLSGRDPGGGAELRRVHGGRPVCGFDLVFAAPKAVSLLHLLAPRELAGVAGAAHGAAVADAVGYLEAEGLGVRRADGGEVRRLATAGVVAAGFVHRTSRALDPHLHTHLVVANVAQGVDGRWSSLDSRRLFLHRRATGAVYDASLRHHLSRAAGVSWSRSATGGWDLVGVDPVLCRAFSQRASGIDEAAHRHTGGRGSPGVRRVAGRSGRPDKDRDVTDDRLRSDWSRRLADLGRAPADLVRVVGAAPPEDLSERIDGRAVAEALTRPHLTRPTPTRRDLVAAVADAAPFGLDGTDVARAATALADGLGPSHRRADLPPWMPVAWARVPGAGRDHGDGTGRPGPAPAPEVELPGPGAPGLVR